MNYRHAFHAGGVADVFKHTVLLWILNRLRGKEASFFCLDTHAGTGLYDLAGAEARRTGEYLNGIARLWTADLSAPLLLRYREDVRACNRDGFLRWYPGSPLLVAANLRAQDHAAVCELHKDDAAELRRNLMPFPSAAVHERNGYEAIRALLPPRAKRGLVLIDPPFESTGELSDAAKGLRDASQRFPTALLALWYPIKERPALWRFEEEVIAAGMGALLAIECLTGDEADSRRLNGSGMLVVNPPWLMEEELSPGLEELGRIVDGRIVFRQLVPAA